MPKFEVQAEIAMWVARVVEADSLEDATKMLKEMKRELFVKPTAGTQVLDDGMVSQGVMAAELSYLG